MVVIITNTSLCAGKGEVLMHRTAARERLTCGRRIHHGKGWERPRRPTKGGRVKETPPAHARGCCSANRMKSRVALPHRDIY